MTEPELRDFCNKMGNTIEFVADELGVEKPLFVLLLFNDPRIAQYVSNCQRKECIESLKETAARLERKEDITR